MELKPEDDSPYPEVRASVPNTDDPTLPHNTVRMWTIGLMMTTLGCAVNVVFGLHSPAFSVTTYVTAIAAWPLGRLWDRLVPNKRVFGLELNPGPFNLKEHALITIMGNVSFGGGAAYMTDIALVMKMYYKLPVTWGFQIVAIFASQAIGYSIAGLVRRVLVYPASMIWPTNLVASTFLTNIHLKVNHVANSWRITRLHFFLLVMGVSIVWTWLPNFFATFLSTFAIGPWIAPNNVAVNQLFGPVSGLGLLPITFDWNVIAGYQGSPLVPPFFAIANTFASLVAVYWIISPAIQFSNVWYGHYLPMVSNSIYDRFQNVYDVSRILTPNNLFDADKYHDYSPLYLTTTYALSYGMSFAAIASAIVHVAVFDIKDIWYYWRNSRTEPDDIHMRLMRRYKEVPDWWFGLCFICFFALSVVSIRVWDTGLPVWALIVALVFALGLLVPLTFIYALTNVQVGLNVFTEFIVGYMLPGRPLAMMMFKTYGYITNYQATTFLQDMKLGHYLKVAPRVQFFAQLVATIWGSLVQVAVLNWAVASIPDICQEDQHNSFSCPNARVFFNASVIWGVIGPNLQLSTLYRPLLWFFFIGGILPILQWLFLWLRPKSWARQIHWPVFFNSVAYIPPATPYNYGAWSAVGFTFAYWIKRNWFNWWAKYNYSLSAGLDLGLALGQLLIFFITLSPHVTAPVWWGSSGGSTDNADSRAEPLRKLPSGVAFGPSTW